VGEADIPRSHAHAHARTHAYPLAIGNWHLVVVEPNKAQKRKKQIYCVRVQLCGGDGLMVMWRGLDWCVPTFGIIFLL
jgi:hypothetical protein